MNESTALALYAGMGILTFFVLALMTMVAALLARVKERDKFLWTLNGEVAKIDDTTTSIFRSLISDVGILSQSIVENYIADVANAGEDIGLTIHRQEFGALMFNAARVNVKAIADGGDSDFWTVVRELAEGLKPLSAAPVKIDANGNIYLGDIKFIEVTRSPDGNPKTRVVEELEYTATTEGIIASER